MDIDIAKLRGNHVYLEFLSPGHREALRFLAKNELIWEFNKMLPIDDSYDAAYDDYFNAALDKKRAGRAANLRHKKNRRTILLSG